MGVIQLITRVRLQKPRLFTDCVRRGGKAVGSVRPSVCLSVCPSVLFNSYLLNRLTFELEFCLSMRHDHSSPGIDSQGSGKGSGYD